MESVEIDREVSETDITEVKEADYRTLNPVFPDKGDDCSISTGAEVLVEKRNDVTTLRLMGHLIPGFINPEESFASEPDCSVKSFPPTLKQRFRNLKPLSEAGELTNRVAALTRSIRREHDSHLHLSEDKDDADLSTATNSSRTVNSVSNPRHRGHRRSDARARRRERLNSDSTMSISQRQLNSSRQIFSSGLSSPEPVTLREIRKDPTEGMRRFSSLFHEDSMGEAVLPNASIDHRLEIAEEAMNFDGSLRSVAKPSSSPSFISTNCPFVTRKRTPMKFGGYRPASGLIFRNLSSDSESDAALLDRFVRKESSNRISRYRDAGNIVTCDSKERKITRGSDFASSNSYRSTPERVTEAASIPVKKLEALEDELFPPMPSAESRISSKDRFESSPEPQKAEKNRWTVIKDTRDLENETCDSLSTKELAVTSAIFDNGNLEREIIPQLEIDSQNRSQSNSLSPESNNKVETIASSLDVKALIRALSSVSLKQEELEKRKSRSTMQEKSPLRYVNRFSGSSGPRSSEYTPAGDPGSRQSLTSVEVSEAHSLIKAPKVDSKTPDRGSVLLKFSERSTRSNSITPEAPEGLSRRSLPGLKKFPVVGCSVPIDDSSRPEVDLIQVNDFIPVIAKVSRTNLVCPEHPPVIKSVGKLIPPKKYPSTNFNDEIDNDKPSTSRTTVSQSSEGSRRSFCSITSIPHVRKVHVKKNDGLQGRRNNLSLSAPLTGRRVLEPLNLAPKVQQENMLSNLDMKFERRRKIASELSEIINGKYETIQKNSPRMILDKKESKKSPSQVRNRRTESFNAGFVQRPKRLITREKNSPDPRRKSSSPDKEGSSGARTPKERLLVKRRRPATEKQSQKLVRPSFREGKDSDLSRKKSSDTLDGKSRVDLMNDHPQNEKEIPVIASRDSRHEENNFREIEVFKQLPNVICASLTRHSSFKTPLIETLNGENKMTSVIKELEKNIQENDHRLINQSIKSDNELQNTITEYLNCSTNKKCDLDNVSSSRSLTSLKSTNSRSSFSNQTKIPVKIPSATGNSYRKKTREVEENPCFETILASGKMKASSTFNKQESATVESTEADQLDFQSVSLAHSSSSSHQNTHRGTNDSTASISVPKLDEIPVENVAEQKLSDRVVKPSEIEFQSSGFEEEQTGNSDTEVISSDNIGDPIFPECIHTAQLLPSDTDELVVETVLDGEKCLLKSSKVSKETSNDLESTVKSSVSETAELAVEKERIVDVLNEDKSDLTIEKNRPENVNSMQFGDSGVGICEKKSSPSIASSAKSEFNFNEKSLLSSTSKWDVTVVNTSRKSQDRFPFTISESASRKTSKFKVVQDMSLDELLRKESTQKTLPKSGDQISSPIETELETIEPDSLKDPILFLDKLANKIADDSFVANNWNSEAPMTKVNYVFYGCKEEQRALMPAVKGMVRKFSARLGCVKTKRQQDPLRILYRNKSCQGESGEDSSSATSLHHSQLLCNKSVSTSVRGSTDGSRGSTGKAVKPKKSSACIGASLEHTPRKSCDRNDLWVQEFDSDVEFDSGSGAANAEANSTEKNRYAIFLAKCKTPEIIGNIENDETNEKNSELSCCEAGDARNIAGRKQNDVDEVELRSPKTPANSYEDEYRIRGKELGEVHDSSLESGCCCLKIRHFFTYSLPEEVKSPKLRNSDKRRRIKFWNNKKK